MRKIFPIILISIFSLFTAKATVEPIYKTGLYSLKISQNGQFIGCLSDNMIIYATATGEEQMYRDCSLGLGNAVADSGLSVGDEGGIAVVMKDGKIIYYEDLLYYSMSALNGVTPDGSRAVGYVNNPNHPDQSMFNVVPMMVELGEDGSVVEMVLLPYPELDLFGSPVQQIQALWISDDGKTVLGQVTENTGNYLYPIIFTESKTGEWEYNLPTESLFNPLGYTIPANPWLNEPPFPEPENYMSALQREKYLLAYQEYEDGLRAEPDPTDYMSEEKLLEYEEAVGAYNKWYNDALDDIMAYSKVVSDILKTSPTFVMQEGALHPSGEYFMFKGGMLNAGGEIDGKIYKIASDGSHIEILEGPNPELYPVQILSNGTMIASLPMMEIPTSYVVLPGRSEFITIQEYLKPKYPELSSWMDSFMPGGSGLVNMSNDMSVITGGLIPEQLADYDYDNADFIYSTYIFTNLDIAGVESIISTEENGIYRVHNLQGVKVMETRESSAINSLPKGIYIINGKKVFVK